MNLTVTDMDEQQHFLRGELFDLTLRATVPRGDRVYMPAPTLLKDRKAYDAAKWEFQKALRLSLEQLEVPYCETVSEEEHIQNIVALSATLSRDHAGVLKDKRFLIGRAQKALNLYLKYLWCLGKVPAPPHCPFDSRVIKKLRGDIKWTAWTSLEKEEDYRKLVAAARVAAAEEEAGMSLAAWELRVYNRG